LSAKHVSLNDNRSYDNYYLAFLAIGDFNTMSPNPEMWNACLRTTRTFMNFFDFDADHVIAHGEAPGAETSCPGRLWDLDKFRKDL